MKSNIRRYPARTILLLLFLLLSGMAHAAYGTQWVEKAIIPVNNKIIMPILSFLPSFMPFSCFEVLVAAGVAGGVAFLVLLIVGGIKAPHKGEFFYRRLCGLLCICAGGYLLFCITWGAYYYRPPLADRLGLAAGPVSSQQLYDAGKILTGQLNKAAKAAPRRENGLFTLPAGKKSVLDKAPQIMQNSHYDFLKGSYPPPKGMLVSPFMNYLFIDGIYGPFTGEANLNIKGHELFFASATLHEMAHQRGIAREDEANFIAYLVGKDCGDPAFTYSSNILAYTHLTDALYTADKKKFQELISLLDPMVQQDFMDYNAFLARYITPAKDISNHVNDTYLKAQGQAEGTKSYGRMVNLLVAQLLGNTE